MAILILNGSLLNTIKVIKINLWRNPVILKIVLISLVIFMIYNLFKALYLMAKNDPNSPPMSTFIGRRLIFSGLIIAIVLVGVATGLITPNARPY
jgi:hypothetical protein